MKKAISEDDVEKSVLGILKEIGYEIIVGDNKYYLPGGRRALRDDYKDVVLVNRLGRALKVINPHIPESAIEDAMKQVLRGASQRLIADNEDFHRMLVDGIDVPVKMDGGGERYEKVWLFEFDPDRVQDNDFMATNQFTVVENGIERRLDIVLFVNGIPLLIFELKNLADEKADVWTAYNQLQTYKKQLPSLFRFNEILVISDGIEARAGTVTSERERFMQWETIDGDIPKKKMPRVEILLRGMCRPSRLLDIVRNFIVFEKDSKTSKKLAAYHQYWAANRAFESTLEARRGDRKGGIVWHTQGSGKSLTMIFYVGKLVRELDNPTLVVLTDRNDLDDQLFGTFSRCQDILRQKPRQASERRNLQRLLRVPSGGIVFTTIQKFHPGSEDMEAHPVLSDRNNIVVIADEAHRSQYGFSAKILNKGDRALIKHGYAKYLRDALPNASFIGFTGTPIEGEDRSTPAVFGRYVDIYDVDQAVKDGATVKIYWESRLAKLDLKPEKRLRIDREFEEVTEGEEVEGKEKLKIKWSRVEKMVGSPERIRRVARDIVEHYEARSSIQEGKAMIVCMSRRICVELHDAIVKIRPRWYGKEDSEGKIKVVMTGSASDPVEWQEHIRNKARRKKIGDRFKDSGKRPDIIIVRDMFLTGFDVPSLHTMYLDKPIMGHTLMQAIARVNRVYPGKEGGLVVDYIGIGVDLKKALADYTKSGGRGDPTIVQDKAVQMMLEKYEVVRDMFHGFDYDRFFDLDPSERVSFVSDAMEHILKEEGKRERFVREVTALLKYFSLAVPDERTKRIRNDVGLFQAIKAAITKTTGTGGGDHARFDAAIKQILSEAIVSDRVIDIFAMAGIRNPEISVLSEEFLGDVRNMPQKNLAFEALRRLLSDEIRQFSKKNIVQGKSFMDMLDRAIRRYTNRRLDAAQVTQELIELARGIRDERGRRKQLNLSEDEIAFYDALGVNDSAVRILGDETLRVIALELTEMIRNSVTIDWTRKASVQARIRLNVKKILKKYGYPPDRKKKAVKTVLQQAEVIAKDWAK